MMLGMAKRDECGSDSASCREVLSRPGQNKEWFAARLFLDVDVAPTHCFADAGAECLGNSLFCRETRSQMASREFHRHRVFNLAVGENTLEKTIAKSIDRSLDPRALDKIDASTDHAHSG